jgi:L-threonylcarbamoyladenylate synthase
MHISKEQFFEKKEYYIQKIKSGSIFIYPTDTIYGIGCNANLDISVKKIRQIKNRPDNKPVSLIAPSKEWIKQNFIVTNELLDKLPGPYTLILRLKDVTNKKISDFVNNNINSTIGVRIPNHWFSKIINEANVPFVTTSVNISSQKHMTCFDDLDHNIKNQVDYIIYEGQKKGKASILIDFSKDIIEVKKR